MGSLAARINASSSNRRALTGIVVLIGFAATLAVTSIALGFWSESTHVDGVGSGAAATVGQGAAPTVSESGSGSAAVNWGPTTLSSGDSVDGYEIKRYDATNDDAAPVTTGCAGTITATHCLETSMPAGVWLYTVTPVLAAHWRGAESVRSGEVNTGPGTLQLDRTVFGPGLPTATSGSLSGFAPNESISYELADGTPLSGVPSSVNGQGIATISSLTIPALADGSYTVLATSATTQATAGILVDTTPPTITPFITPAPNGAGWNNVSPVEVNAVVDDGDGSGLAWAKYTDDGSDPKTSPTARFALGPLSIATTTTLRFYGADQAGNESAVQTLPVRIDLSVPYFSVDFVDIEGGAYISPADESTGAPGSAYYRGAASGSFRFRMTPIPTGGSPAASAGFSALPPDAFGFSFDSSAVTTPPGGPFISSPISWVAGTTSTPSGTISLTDAADNTFGSPGAIYNDSTPPSGGSVDAVGLTGTNGRYSASLDLTLNLSKGADDASGVADNSGPSDIPAQLLRASAPLASNNGVADGSCGTYTAYSQVGGDDPPATVEDTVPSDNTCYRYRYLVADHVGNVAVNTSPDIKAKAVPTASLTPTAATLTPVTGVTAQSVSGSTVYYNPAQSGSFHVDSSATSPSSGISHLTFPEIAGFSGGGAVASPTTGSTFRSTYHWSANGASPSPGAQAISATNNAGESATNPSAFSMVEDDVGPTGGAVDATGLVGTGGRYSTSMTLHVGFTPGTDAGSGVVTSRAQLRRASATLISGGANNGTCGTFGSSTQVGTDNPASPATDTVPVDRTCYRYTYVVSDAVGNQTTYTSPAVKVYAAAPPAPTLSFTGLSNSYWSGTGTAIFYRPVASSGGFTVTANSVDAVSYSFPILPAGWNGSSAGSGTQDYSWGPLVNPTPPTGNQKVTMTSDAGTKSSANFTATPDTTFPNGGSVTSSNGFTNGSFSSISFSKGTDTGSGLDTTSGIVEQSSATLSAGNCGTFGPWTTAAVNPSSGVSVPVSSNTCYRFRYLISDRVGNQTTYTNGSVAKVDYTGPTNAISMTNPVSASMTNTTIYYKGDVAGSFNLVNAVADAGSGPASSTFNGMSTPGWTHPLETVSTPNGGPYTSSTFRWTPGAGAPPNLGVNGTDVVGKSATSGSVAFNVDTISPTGGGITYPNGVVTSPSVPVTTSPANDFQSGMDPTADTIRRDVAPLTNPGQTCGAFPGTYATTVTSVGGADTSVATGNCYKYRFLVSDKVGNKATFSSGSVVKVDSGG